MKALQKLVPNARKVRKIILRL
uniref:Uncharacterized protein n=1 Tax=Rhizophora mucronata TaxID=61149 RepID=A0A2P2LAV8_RHIMU